MTAANVEQLYSYRAIDRDGAVTSGKLRAADSGAAARLLLAQGLRPLQVESTLDSTRAPAAGGWARHQRLRRQDLCALLQELATLLGAGIALSEVMPTLTRAHARGPLGSMLAVANQRLRAGANLSAALDQPGLAWPGYVMALLRAGEASGQMAQALRSGADQMEHDLAITRELRNALVYPFVLVLAGVAAVLIILVGVVPRFAGVIRSSKADVPEISRWLIETGVWMQQHLASLALGVGLVAVAVSVSLSQAAVRDALFQTLSRWPVIGPWLRSVDIGRWALVLGALLGNRVPIVDALKLSAGSLRVRELREGLTRCALQVQQGRTLSEVFEHQSWFPEARLSLISVGERSGELARMMRSLGEVETQTSRTLQRRLLTLLEPLAVLLIGAVIGFIMVAVMMAITGLNTAVS